jgi:hypothetical protein
VACGAHVVQNVWQAAADCSPMDTQIAIGKVEQYFHIYPARIQILKDSPDFIYMEYKNILDHNKTRRLSLMPSVQRAAVVYSTLASYFFSIEKCPTMLQFFKVNSPFHI